MPKYMKMAIENVQNLILYNSILQKTEQKSI